MGGCFTGQSLMVRTVSSELVQIYCYCFPSSHLHLAATIQVLLLKPLCVLTGLTCSSCNLHCKFLFRPCQFAFPSIHYSWALIAAWGNFILTASWSSQFPASNSCAMDPLQNYCLYQHMQNVTAFWHFPPQKQECCLVFKFKTWKSALIA